MSSRPPSYIQFSPTTNPAETPAWVDVSAYVRSANTKRGRQQELDRDEAGRASATFKNGDRRFDPLNSAGPYYPGIAPMKRVRFGGSVLSEPDPYLLLSTSGSDYAWTPNQGGLSFTSDFDLRADVALDDWTPAASAIVVARANPTGAVVRDWAFRVTSAGELELTWSATGTVPFTTATSSALGLANGTRKWVRATMDLDGTGSGWIVVFYTSTDGSSWTTIDTVTDTPSASISNAADFVLVGAENSSAGFGGSVHQVQIRSTIGGTVRGNPIFSDPELWWVGDKTGLDAQGNVWSLAGGASIPVGRQYTFSGFCLDWVQSWPKKRNAVARLTCVDAFHVLNLVKLTESYSEELSSERVDALLDAAGVSAAERTIATGKSDVIGVELEETPALEHIQHVVESESGRFFMSALGIATFRNRHTQLLAPYTTSLATFGDSGAELRYSTAEVIQSESLIYNEGRISRIGGAYQSASDSASQTAYFKRTYTKSNLLITLDTECQAAAQWLVYIYKDPRTRIEKMAINVARDPLGLAPQILGRELGDRITVRRRPPGGGALIEQISIIEGIEHEIGPGRWLTTWSLSPATNIQPGIWDHATYGKADETAIAIY